MTAYNDYAPVYAIDIPSSTRLENQHIADVLPHAPTIAMGDPVHPIDLDNAENEMKARADLHKCGYASADEIRQSKEHHRCIADAQTVAIARAVVIHMTLAAAVNNIPPGEVPLWASQIMEGMKNTNVRFNDIENRLGVIEARMNNNIRVSVKRLGPITAENSCLWTTHL